MSEQVVFGLVQALVALPALFFIIGRLWFPKTFHAEDFPETSTLFQKCKVYGGYLVVFVGLSVVCFHGAGALVSWMPDSWGGLNEDGDWEAARPGFQIAAGSLAALCLLVRSIQLGEIAAKREVELRFTLAMIQSVGKPVYAQSTGQDVQTRFLSDARGALSEPSNRVEGLGESAYRKRLLRWLG